MKYWDFRECGKPQYDYYAYTDGSYLLPKNYGAAACLVLAGEDEKPLYQWSEVSRYLTGQVRSKKDTDLVQLYRQVKKERALRVTLEWVRSHSGDRWNDYVDYLCIEALDLFEANGTRVREGVDPEALFAYICKH